MASSLGTSEAGVSKDEEGKGLPPSPEDGRPSCRPPRRAPAPRGHEGHDLPVTPGLVRRAFAPDITIMKRSFVSSCPPVLRAAASSLVTPARVAGVHGFA